MNKSVAFLGTGKMGTPMAKNLLQGKIPVYIFNRSPEKAASLLQEGAKLICYPADAYRKADIAITMLANDQAVEELTFGPEGLLTTIKPGDIHISMSTISPHISQKLEVLHREKGAYYLAAPVFGRPEAAAAAKLWIVIGGDTKAKAEVKPILTLLGQRIEDFGEEAFKANIVKILGNFLILSAIEALGEALKLAGLNGIASEHLISFFTQTLFPSPVYQNYGKLIASGKFEPAGFKLILGLKDINLIQHLAEDSDVNMPLVRLLHDLLIKGISEDRGELDWSAITLSSSKNG